MEHELSPQNAQYLERIVAGGFYPSKAAALDAAVAALREKTEEIPFVLDEHMEAVEQGIAEADAGLVQPMTNEDWSRLHNTPMMSRAESIRATLNAIRVPHDSRGEQDLRQIVDYIATDNLSAAIAWLDQFEALFQLLATQPEMGQRKRQGDSASRASTPTVTTSFIIDPSRTALKSYVSYMRHETRINCHSPCYFDSPCEFPRS